MVFSILSIVFNVLAVIIAPIISVRIAQKLQENDKKRQDKMEVFKALMTGRIYLDSTGWPPQSVHALNIIDIVFADDEAVRKQWKIYYDALCVVHPNEAESKKMRKEQDKLLETMANSLGYKDIVSWETIQNPYIPNGFQNQISMQKLLQNSQVELTQEMLFAIKNNGGTNNGQNGNANP